jgi:CubicO group peptidase (beta-lactamase class C family)
MIKSRAMRVILTSLLILVFVSACSGQTQFPDTPAGRQAAAWLEAFNGGNLDRYREFLQKNFPERAAGVEQRFRFREMTGGFELRKMEESTPTKLSALIQERRSDQFARLTLEVDNSEIHQITRLDIFATSRPADFALPHLSDSELVATLRKKLQEDAAADQFSGAVLVAKDGKAIFSQAYGLADREKKTANTLSTRFRLGSMNKMFTAVAILQLVQAGKLGLKDPFGKYLTDYPNKEMASKVTIEQLLTHSGGTGDIFGPDFDKHRLELRTLQDYVKLYGNRALLSEPGSGFRYSNYGFILLGVLVEKVSGQSYYDYVRQHIFKPAGMTGTDSEPENQPVANRSVGYMKPDVGGQWQPNTDTLPYRGTSAGGGYSTVEDLLRFATALQNNKLLNAEYTALLTTGKIEGLGAKYAYGFSDRIENGTRCFGHGGGAPGMNGELAICPGPGFIIAVLSNLDPPAASLVSSFVLNRLPAK